MGSKWSGRKRRRLGNENKINELIMILRIKEETTEEKQVASKKAMMEVDKKEENGEEKKKQCMGKAEQG